MPQVPVVPQEPSVSLRHALLVHAWPAQEFPSHPDKVQTVAVQVVQVQEGSPATVLENVSPNPSIKLLSSSFMPASPLVEVNALPETDLDTIVPAGLTVIWLHRQFRRTVLGGA